MFVYKIYNSNKKTQEVNTSCDNKTWAQMDSNHRSRKTADLQSAPFGRSGIRPQKKSLLSDSNQRPRDYKSRALAN